MSTRTLAGIWEDTLPWALKAEDEGMVELEIYHKCFYAGAKAVFACLNTGGSMADVEAEVEASFRPRSRIAITRWIDRSESSGSGS